MFKPFMILVFMLVCQQFMMSAAAPSEVPFETSEPLTAELSPGEQLGTETLSADQLRTFPVGQLFGEGAGAGAGVDTAVLGEAMSVDNVKTDERFFGPFAGLNPFNFGNHFGNQFGGNYGGLGPIQGGFGGFPHIPNIPFIG